MFDNADFWITATTMFGIALAAYTLILWVALIAWTYRDARARMVDTNMQIAATLLVAVFNIPGLLLYLAVRPPEPLSEAYSRQLEAEAFLQDMQKHESCRGCRRSVDPDFVACPYCRTALQEPCGSCGRNLQLSWTICPYCTAERRAVAARPAVASAGGTPTRTMLGGSANGFAYPRARDGGDGRKPARVQPI
jgi:hypothetical protein